MKNVIKISALLLLTLTFGCKSDDDIMTIEDSSIVGDFTSLEAEYGCVNTPYGLEIGLDNTFTIMFSQDDFNSLITGTCTPEIDFETYDLIVGKQGLTNGFDSITYAVVENPLTNALAVTVTFKLNATAEAPNAAYHLLVPKLTNPLLTTVDVIIN